MTRPISSTAHRSSTAISLDVSGCRVSREDVSKEEVVQVGDTDGTSIYDDTPHPGPFQHDVFPFDLNGSERITSKARTTAAPESDPLLQLTSGSMALYWFLRRRQRGAATRQKDTSRRSRPSST